MKALTLWQPWAGAMALGLKRIETRSWRMDYRGDLCIHASMRKMTDEDWLCVPYETRVNATPDTLRVLSLRGGILAVVEVYDCIATHLMASCGGIPEGDEFALGNYSPGRYGIMTRNLRVLRKPVACKGMQMLWNVPPEIEAKMKEQIP